MAFWKKSGPTIGEGDENPAEQEIEEVNKKPAGEQFGGKIDLELAKIHGQIESFGEIRKATTERFSIINEQIGELRGQITDLTKGFSKVEVGATKAIDKVESVQPEIFMTELRKNEGKIDALKANIESNESLMQDLMSEIKAMRHQMDLYKGTEQILKMHEEIKEELTTIKKEEAIVERHANRVETMFLDTEKKFAEFDEYDSAVKELNRNFKKIQADFDKIRVRTDTKADKKEFVNLVNKFNDFEKHTGNIIKLLDERSKHAKDDIKTTFDNIKKEVEKKYDIKLGVKIEQTPEKKNTEEIKETKEGEEDKEKKKGFSLFGKKEENQSKEDDKKDEKKKEDSLPKSL
ncbi:MAG: hypothetical protein ABH828_03355 [archaeon]